MKGKQILHNINLSLDSGHIYGFYGRNGSGKTMLFRAMTTLIVPDKGDVLIDGQSILKTAFDLRQIGLLIEDAGFYPYLTGYENLALLYEINHKKNKQHLFEVLKQVGLEGHKNELFSTYSLGMKQKLRIAQAFMEDQKIIILDEPTNGLDEHAVKDLYQLLFTLKQENRLIVLASHLKEDLETLCDHVYHIDQGELV